MTRNQNEIIIGYVEQKKVILKSLEKDPRLSSASFKNLSEKINALGDLKKNESSQFANHIFDEGGAIHFLFIKTSVGTYELQTAIRKNLATQVRSKGFVVKLKRLSKPHQIKALDAVAGLSVLETWQFPVYGMKAKEHKEKSPADFEFDTSVPAPQARSLVSKSKIVSHKTNLVRTLATTPANHLNPGKYKKILQDRSKKGKFSYSFIDVKQLEKMNAGGILAVLRADPNTEGGIVHLKYRPKNAKKVLSLVGKGLCFDTGGYNIKTGEHMLSMHRDMTGSAVALGIFEALVELKAPFEVHAFLAIAENLISPTGYKPNEVVITMDGTSIETVDTDAEGRMVLCDTLSYSKQVKPDLILDFATLTGAAVYSIGTRRAAFFSNHMKLSELATAVGTESGERGWHFPINEDFLDNIKSDIADILQCSTARGVDHINAASFLSHFVGDTPWVHVDLSTDESRGGLGLVSTDVTGFGVRWGIQFVEKYFKKNL